MTRAQFLSVSIGLHPMYNQFVYFRSTHLLYNNNNRLPHFLLVVPIDRAHVDGPKSSSQLLVAHSRISPLYQRNMRKWGVVVHAFQILGSLSTPANA